jgi:hypothetical protein
MESTMTTDLRPAPAAKTMPRRSWVLVLAAELFALAQAFFMLFHGGVNGSIEEFLGYPNDTLQENGPLSTVLLDLTRSMGLWGVALIGFAIVITLIPYRRGERWAWRALWIFPATYLFVLPLERLVFGDAWPEVAGLGITVLYFSVPAIVGLILGARHGHR